MKKVVMFYGDKTERAFDERTEYILVDGVVYSRFKGLAIGCLWTEWTQEYGMTPEEWEAMPEYSEEYGYDEEEEAEEILEEE